MPEPSSIPAEPGPRALTVRAMLSPGARVPSRAHADDAGLDLCAVEDAVIPPLGRALIGTGVAIAIPAGTAGMVCPRSGLAVRHGITVLNGPGIVDAGYRGEIKVPLHNTDPEQSFPVRAGDRIAQLVIVPVLAPDLEIVESLDETERATGGFGSSGGFGQDPSSRREV